MSGRLGDRITGYVFIGCAFMLVAAMIGRAALGHSEGWWEYVVMAVVVALFVAIAVGLIAEEPASWLTPAILVAFALCLLAMALVAIVRPTAAVIDAGRGPRTALAARGMGVTLLVAGTAMLGVGIGMARRLRHPTD